jgi:thioredoxin-like negative regulator of GroEL
VLVVVLAAASAAGWAVRLRNGRFRAQSAAADLATMLSAADLGAPLGQRATLVQFSTDFCAYCGPTRELLADVAGSRDGVALVEIDATARLDLARRLNVLSTPTVLVLASDGSIARRSSGRQRRSDVLAAVSGVLGEAPAERGGR